MARSWIECSGQVSNMAGIKETPHWNYIPPEAQTVTDWSGGQTRELYLAPAGTSYAGRDFTLRLSSATLEVAESTFTHLPDYERILMPLTGTIRLQHDGGRVRTLPPYTTDSFAGGAATTSWGECRDFNVMLRRGSGYTAHVEAVETHGQTVALPIGGLDYIYAAQGGCHWQGVTKTHEMAEGGLLVMRRQGELHLQPQGRAGLLVHVSLRPAD